MLDMDSKCKRPPNSVYRWRNLCSVFRFSGVPGATIFVRKKAIPDVGKQKARKKVGNANSKLSEAKYLVLFLELALRVTEHFVFDCSKELDTLVQKAHEMARLLFEMRNLIRLGLFLTQFDSV